MVQCVENIMCVQTGVCCNKQSVVVTVWEVEQRHRYWLLNWKVGLNVHSKWRNFLSVIIIKPNLNLFFPAKKISHCLSQLCTGLPSDLFASDIPTKIFLSNFHLIHLLYMPRLWVFPLFNQDNIMWKVQSCKSSLLNFFKSPVIPYVSSSNTFTALCSQIF